MRIGHDDFGPNRTALISEKLMHAAPRVRCEFLKINTATKTKLVLLETAPRIQANALLSSADG